MIILQFSIAPNMHGEQYSWNQVQSNYSFSPLDRTQQTLPSFIKRFISQNILHLDSGVLQQIFPFCLNKLHKKKRFRKSNVKISSREVLKRRIENFSQSMFWLFKHCSIQFLQGSIRKICQLQNILKQTYRYIDYKYKSVKQPILVLQEQMGQQLASGIALFTLIRSVQNK